MDRRRGIDGDAEVATQDPGEVSDAGQWARSVQRVAVADSDLPSRTDPIGERPHDGRLARSGLTAHEHGAAVIVAHYIVLDEAVDERPAFQQAHSRRSVDPVVCDAWMKCNP